MIGRRIAGSANALPLQRGRALPLLVWAVALAAYIAGLGAVGLLVISRSEAAWRRSPGATLTLEVPADTSPARLKTVLAVLRQTPGIVAVTPLTAADEARLLEPWLGPGARLDGLPVPQLIDLRSAAPGAVDLAGLRDKLASVVPDAKLDDHARWFGDMRRAALRVRLALAALIAAGLLAVAPAALFAAGSAFAADRALIELVQRLGARDRDIARPLTLRALRLGLAGGAIGGAAVILTIAVFGPAAAIWRPVLLSPVGPSDWRLWALVAAIAFGAGLIAAGSARASLARRLAEWR